MGAGDGTGGSGRQAARVGLLASSLLVFLGGYYAMRADDWRRIAAFSLLALLGGVLASAFARRARSGD